MSRGSLGPMTGVAYHVAQHLPDVPGKPILLRGSVCKPRLAPSVCSFLRVMDNVKKLLLVSGPGASKPPITLPKLDLSHLGRPISSQVLPSQVTQVWPSQFWPSRAVANSSRQ